MGAEGTTWSIPVLNSDITADGDYDFYVRYVDLAGNESDPSADLTVTIDRDVPDQPTITMDGSDGTEFHIHDGDHYTQRRQSDLHHLGPGRRHLAEHQGGRRVRGLRRRSRAPLMTLHPPTSRPPTWTAPSTPSRWWAVDSAGNASPQAEFSFTLDTTADSISGVQLTAASDSGESATDDYTNVTTPTIEGRAEANAAVTVVLKDAGGNVVFTDNAVTAGRFRPLDVHCHRRQRAE